ncbi:MAG: GNAT family N-acetyltransferase [Acidobacteria bacterium]|nr:GNAT family N-acetyltransferase [Acidobacteriota bacterium]
MGDAVRRVLHTDPWWSLYALGDLAPSRRDHCQWLVNNRETALILLYSEFGTPILFATGEPHHFEELVPMLPDQVYLNLQPRLLPVFQSRYPQAKMKPMIRMAYHGGTLPTSADVAQLSSRNLEEMQSLYDDGTETGESPEFFFPQMVDDGCFHGIYVEGELAAAAGTHMVYEEESIGAIGNVYTRRKWRRRGLGRMVTASVVNSLLARGIRTIGLNVSAGNPARQVYESLGFVHHCDFLEGPASA